jgi:UDP-4-amino-4,6-dideoxy-N-acetyl-beta-L-altrosamine transaminase
MEFIHYGTHIIEDDDIEEVVKVLRSDYLTTGPKAQEFESIICAETGAKYAVATANGTAALHLATLTLKLNPGDEVIVTPLTFAASANCVLYSGGVPVFADIDSDTMLMDTEDVKRKITPKTKAIIAVHYGGELCDMESLSEIATENNLQLIQDSAHSLGGTVNGKKQGKYPGLQTWSFHPVKTITTGEGGAVTTNDEGIYRLLKRLRTAGITRDRSEYTPQETGIWAYDMLELGFNYRITDFQCVLGISQMKKLQRFAARRAEIVEKYNVAFETLPIKIQHSPKWSNPVRHLYTIRLDDKSRREEVFNKLREKQILVNVHYIPVYWLSYYANLGYERGLCPIAEDSYERLITIPLHPKLSDEQVEYVIETVRDALK